MTIGTLDFLDFANDLNSKKTECETVRRVVVGRAYYSIYHCAVQFASSDLGIDLDDLNLSTHAGLFKGLREYSTKNQPLRTKLQALSRDLKRLHSLRVHADYYLHRTITQKHVDTALADAGWLSRRISELQAGAAVA